MNKTRTLDEFETLVRHPELLRVLMQIHQWECNQQKEMDTISGRDLYLRIAVGLLVDDETPQALKLLQGPLTERATRQRLKGLEADGLLEVMQPQASDLRTKRAVPTAKFVNRLNLHLDLLMEMCEEHFIITKRTKPI
jgi:DNA-binding HxlR family transcriptional regulator